MKKIISLLSIALILIVGSAVYASADEGTVIGEKAPAIEERQPNFSERGSDGRFHHCHRYGGPGYGNKHHYYEERDGEGYGQMPPGSGEENTGYGFGLGPGMRY